MVTNSVVHLSLSRTERRVRLILQPADSLCLHLDITLRWVIRWWPCVQMFGVREQESLYNFFRSVPSSVCLDLVLVSIADLARFSRHCSRFLLTVFSHVWCSAKALSVVFVSTLRYVVLQRPQLQCHCPELCVFPPKKDPPPLSCDGKKTSLYIQNYVIFPTLEGSFRIYITDNSCQFSVVMERKPQTDNIPACNILFKCAYEITA